MRSVGVDEELKRTCAKLMTELHTLNTSTVLELHETVVANIQEAEKLRVVAENATTSQAACCAHMQTKGKDVANMQKPLHGMCARVKQDFPDIEARGGHTASDKSQDDGTGGAAFDKLKTAYVACMACEDVLYYFTAMYVGLTLLRTPATANTGSPSHGRLKELVKAMGSVK